MKLSLFLSATEKEAKYGNVPVKASCLKIVHYNKRFGFT